MVRNTLKEGGLPDGERARAIHVRANDSIRTKAALWGVGYGIAVIESTTEQVMCL